MASSACLADGDQCAPRPAHLEVVVVQMDPAYSGRRLFEGLRGIICMYDNGWGGDHVGKLLRLQTAVRILAEGQRKTTERLQRATYALATLSPTDFPQHLRNPATRVLEFRKKYVFHAGGESYFHPVKPNDKTRFVSDLITLYEACLIDIGRGWPMWDFMYPKDE
jgi:hypothetical protein